MKVTKATLKQIIKEELEALNERMPALGKAVGRIAADRERRREEAADDEYEKRFQAGRFEALEERVRMLEDLMGKLMDTGEVDF